ncbi:hypothetical protein [Streptomyces pulveraceus]|uniref:Uncharacterized protein n=1 Tax=Streptomyces pulveraceus TaxID=68258 RepID=A0ABW1GKH8_9ACTN
MKDSADRDGSHGRNASKSRTRCVVIGAASARSIGLMPVLLCMG